MPRETETMPVDPILAPIALPAILSGYTAWRARRLTRAHPPRGRFADTRAGRLHHCDEGAGETPVVFLHGASGTLNVWHPAFGPDIARAGRRLLVDRPGHGHSERRAGREAARLSHQAGAIVDLLDAVGAERAILVAHSWSGALAMRFALDHPDRTAGLLLLAPVTHPWPGGITWYYTLAARPRVGPLFTWTLALPGGEAWMSRGIDSVFAPQAAPPAYAQDAAIPLVLRPSQFRANAEDCDLLLDEVTAQAPRYRDVRCPLTIMAGTADAVVWTHLHSHGLVRDIPHARYIEMPGVGHAPHHAEPASVLDEIVAMRKGLQSPSNRAVDR